MANNLGVRLRCRFGNDSVFAYWSILDTEPVSPRSNAYRWGSFKTLDEWQKIARKIHTEREIYQCPKCKLSCEMWNRLRKIKFESNTERKDFAMRFHL